MAITGILIQAVLLGVGVSIITAIFASLWSESALPKDIPRVRDGQKSRFSWGTRIAYLTDCKKLWREAYETYSKNGMTCLVPGLGSRTEVILPSSSMKWAANQPDTVLSSPEANRVIDSADYTVPYPAVITDPWQGHLVKTEIMKVIEPLMEGLYDEFNVAFLEPFGTDTESWNEIPLWTTLERVIAQGSSRFTVGLPLCRDKDYLNIIVKANHAMILGAGLVGMTPKILKPILGPIFCLPNRYWEWRQGRATKSLYDQRMSNLREPPKDTNYEEPVDHFQMILRYARENRSAEFNLNSITGRLIISNFGAIHNTAMAITHLLFDIVASDAQFNTIALLREEIDSVFTKYGAWTKPAVAKMIRADSAMRESTRLNMFGNRSLLRMVTAPEGIKTPDGFQLKKGTMISVLSHPAQQDADAGFTDPEVYDPFRFSRQREAANAKKLDDQANADGKSASESPDGTLAFVATGPTNLIFGHGRHACPGRFLVDFEFKMILSYVLMHYDLELPAQYGGKRPESRWILEATMPPDATLKVRRRKGTT